MLIEQRKEMVHNTDQLEQIVKRLPLLESSCRTQGCIPAGCRKNSPDEFRDEMSTQSGIAVNTR